MHIRQLQQTEVSAALVLAMRVFMRFEAPDYSEQGIQSFYDTIYHPDYVVSIQCYGAFDESQLVGILATRNQGTHITLFFVEETYHQQGIGRKLFEAAKANAVGKVITVNSSPYAVKVYRRLGFMPTKGEQQVQGIRYTPMEYRPIRTQQEDHSKPTLLR